MATNKHATIRYQALDRCFRNPGRKYYIEDLVEECNKAIYEFAGVEDGVKRRQIYADITFMESGQGWSIPLERISDGRKKYYRYSDMSFSINSQPLNETEENLLKEALLTLSRFKGMPQFEWVDEIKARLDSGLGLKKDQKIIEFEQNDYLIGTEYISPLYNAIHYKKVLSVNYQSFRSGLNQDITFHPYFLKQYNNRWFVFGLDGKLRLLTNLALDRIKGITELNVDYIPNKEIDFSEYFEDVIGVTVHQNKKTEKILLKISAELYPYIKTKPLHGSQKLKEIEKDFVIVELELIPNYELEALILERGEGIEVLQPESLREKIKSRIKQAFEKYK